MYCFYHSADFDGHCSGAIVKRMFPEVKLRGIDYGQQFPWEEVEPGETVFMVDFTLQPFEDMARLIKYADVIWLDHHIAAIRERDAWGELLTYYGEQEVGLAGCELTWNYLYPNKTMPMAVYHTGRFDVWDHSHEYTLPFQSGLKLYNSNPNNNELWDELLEPGENKLFYEILDKGCVVLDYITADNEKYVAACAFETSFEGYRALVVNKMLTNSQLFDSMFEESNCDFMVTFGWQRGKWLVSLYSPEGGVDVSVIAVKYGGGGHANASGFRAKRLPFELK